MRIINVCGKQRADTNSLSENLFSLFSFNFDVVKGLRFNIKPYLIFLEVYNEKVYSCLFIWFGYHYTMTGQIFKKERKVKPGRKSGASKYPCIGIFAVAEDIGGEQWQ